MHPSAIKHATRFVKKYLDPFDNLVIIDVGSFNVNGCLKPLFTFNGATCSYCGNVKPGDGITNLTCGAWNCYSQKSMEYHHIHDGENCIPIELDQRLIGKNWKYLGLEIKESCEPYGPILDENYKRYNVDIILESPHSYPFQDNEVDVVLSTSCFEHDPAFWLTFKEMVRVTKNNGLIYLNVPSSGPYHGYPIDCWRFLKDSYLALSMFCPEAQLVNSYIDPTGSWQDNIGIFRIQK